MSDQPREPTEPPRPSSGGRRLLDAFEKLWHQFFGRRISDVSENPPERATTFGGSEPQAEKPRQEQVSFSEESWVLINQLSRERQKPLGRVLTDALAFERWYWDARDKGHRILVERGRKFYEIRRPR